MPKHEFYAEPTVFDQWQSSVECWLLLRREKLAPYSWFMAFSGLALTFLLVAMVVCLDLLQQNAGGLQAQTWNQIMAEGVTLIVALLASQHLLYQAKRALPDPAMLPAKIRDILDFVVGAAGTPGTGNPCADTDTPRSAAPRPEPTLQEFFAGVRAAGVNVSIARTLFTAGIRSPRQLLACDDVQLLQIRGIGPATVCKLRNHFDQVSRSR